STAFRTAPSRGARPGRRARRGRVRSPKAAARGGKSDGEARSAEERRLRPDEVARSHQPVEEPDSHGWHPQAAADGRAPGGRAPGHGAPSTAAAETLEPRHARRAQSGGQYARRGDLDSGSNGSESNADAGSRG